ncbi:hypothetical protein [Quatrionicoccus australiensis]|uniref:hypothetical protein n=1 Tax=Quatrionicoccus australiensis TaxID=138118 RepID=UPI001CFB9782|nr:hypothetical protein [Quatrionicoccus australiensis]MCB4359707.1 hypothetical protein [Quatrionicoccus australiensis]
MAKPNYQFEKRQRDLAKKNKQEEKRRQKLAGNAGANSNEAVPHDELPVATAAVPEGNDSL